MCSSDLDMDAQGNATSGVGIRKPDVTRDIYDVLVNELPIDEVTLITEIGRASCRERV